MQAMFGGDLLLLGVGEVPFEHSGLAADVEAVDPVRA